MHRDRNSLKIDDNNIVPASTPKIIANNAPTSDRSISNVQVNRPIWLRCLLTLLQEKDRHSNKKKNENKTLKRSHLFSFNTTHHWADIKQCKYLVKNYDMDVM